VRKLLGHLALAGVVVVCLTAGAAAQSPPYVYPITVTTSSAQILPERSARKKLIFHNPNDQIKVAVCPVGPSRSNGATITAVINGAGCITILPYDRVEVSGSTASGPQQAMPSAWLGIGSSSGALTVYEFE
jgi:hypothetical protein